ncbi:MAG: RIP metalloprotease RseP [Thermaerobacterales bacterium]
MTLLVTVIVFGLLIFIHELGHFLVAKRAGVLVHEFALGFGPRIYSFRRQETEYSLRAVPLGGFVRMAGMHPKEEDLENIDRRRWFLNKSIGQRMGIIVAGPLMNFVLAAVLFAGIFGVIGVASPTLEIEMIQPGYPADEAGLQPGDEIRSIDGVTVTHWDELVAMVQDSPNEPLEFVVDRGNESISMTMTPDQRPDGRGVIGIQPAMVTQRAGPGTAVAEGVLWTGRIVGAFFEAIGLMISGQGGADVVGPVGIGQHIGEATRTGLPNLVFLAALLSANLGLINLLPIPPLDGSRLIFMFWEMVRGRPVDPEKEGLVHFIGFALLLMLAIFITYRDILRLT